jgi:hypothetical protein
MSEKDPNPVPETPGAKQTSEESDAMKQMEEDADEMAEQGIKSQNKYDQDHNIFSK